VSARFPTLAELKGLAQEDLPAVAEEFRHLIIQTCLKNGGHLGASLGAVEIAIALHRVFDSPTEPIYWDVGHQAYAHKLLTGRAESFETLRQLEGVCGFLSRDESEHDVWGAGHSSTALSAALACAWGRGREAGGQDSAGWTVAVVGDGGMTAGLALEALNNVKARPIGPLLVVLNDNQMSISPNVGAISKLLADGRAEIFFQLFGFDYVGPIDGHNLDQLVGTLGGIRANYSGRPVLLHVLTQKGKGYAPAEERPESFHGVSPVTSGKKPAATSWSEQFGEVLCRLAEENPNVVAITAAMPEGTGLQAFARKFPDRFFDVGIAEQHAVTFAAGLAARGFLPVVAIYSTFLQRALDSIIHDVAIQKLPVCFAVDRAGLVGADGSTHHGAFDLSFLAAIPGLRLYSPAVYDDLEKSLTDWVRGNGASGPCAIRYPRGGGSRTLEPKPIDDESAVRVLHSDPAPRRILAALGAAYPKALKASAEWTKRGIAHEILVVTQSKPIPSALVKRLTKSSDAMILTVEDGSRIGGFGERLRGELNRPVKAVAYPDEFIPHGAVDELEKRIHLTWQDLAAL